MEHGGTICRAAPGRGEWGAAAGVRGGQLTNTGRDEERFVVLCGCAGASAAIFEKTVKPETHSQIIITVDVFGGLFTMSFSIKVLIIKALTR